jgi:hypothetical protein
MPGVRMNIPVHIHQGTNTTHCPVCQDWEITSTHVPSERPSPAHTEEIPPEEPLEEWACLSCEINDVKVLRFRDREG